MMETTTERTDEQAVLAYEAEREGIMEVAWFNRWQAHDRGEDVDSDVLFGPWDEDDEEAAAEWRALVGESDPDPVAKGSASSGNYGHAGRPKLRGGSAKRNIERVEFHGTYNEAFAGIAIHGLKPGTEKSRAFAFSKEAYEGDRGKSVYVTDTFDSAVMWVYQNAPWKEGALNSPTTPRGVRKFDAAIAVFEVHIPPEMVDKLVVDEAGILDDKGAKRYLGSIPPEWIKKAWVIQQVNGELFAPKEKELYGAEALARLRASEAKWVSEHPESAISKSASGMPDSVVVYVVSPLGLGSSQGEDLVSKYRVDQERDYHGRFADEGGGGSSSSGAKEEKPPYSGRPKHPKLSTLIPEGKAFAPSFGRSLADMEMADYWRLELGKKPDWADENTLLFSIVPYDIPDYVKEAPPRRAGDKTWYDPELATVDAEGRTRAKEEDGWSVDFPVKQKEAPKGVLYRGMSAAEYEEMKRTGKVKSLGSYNIGPDQEGLTYFSASPEQAASYASGFSPWQFQPAFDRPAYVVAIRDPGTARHVAGTDEDERGIPGDIEASEILDVWEGRPYSIKAGYMEMYERQIGVLQEGSRSSASSNVVWRVLSSARTGVKKYSPDQERDDHGRWTDEGGPSTPEDDAPSQREALYNRMPPKVREAIESALEEMGIRQADQIEHRMIIDLETGEKIFEGVGDAGGPSGAMAQGLADPSLDDLRPSGGYVPRELLYDRKSLDIHTHPKQKGSVTPPPGLANFSEGDFKSFVASESDVFVVVAPESVTVIRKTPEFERYQTEAWANASGGGKPWTPRRAEERYNEILDEMTDGRIHPKWTDDHVDAIFDAVNRKLAKEMGIELLSFDRSDGGQRHKSMRRVSGPSETEAFAQDVWMRNRNGVLEVVDVQKYSPDQERDWHGRFSYQGGDTAPDSEVGVDVGGGAGLPFGPTTKGHEIDPRTIEDILAKLEADEEYMTGGSDQTKGDRLLADLAAKQGFDGLPSALSQDDFDAMQGKVYYRGIGSTKQRGDAYVEAFLYGKYYAGFGVSGNGSYFSDSQNLARDYGNGIIEMKLKPDAVVMDRDEAAKKIANIWERIAAKYYSDARASGSPSANSGAFYGLIARMDAGRVAAFLGIDALRVGAGSYYNSKTGRNEVQETMIILNRTALAVLRDKREKRAKVQKYSPDQTRDFHGRFAYEGGNRLGGGDVGKGLLADDAKWGGDFVENSALEIKVGDVLTPENLGHFRDRYAEDDIEHMLIVGADGVAVAVEHGTSDAVFIPEDLRNYREPGNPMVGGRLEHNHPIGVSFSTEDLMIFMDTGVSRMTAFGKTIDGKSVLYELRPGEGKVEEVDKDYVRGASDAAYAVVITKERKAEVQAKLAAARAKFGAGIELARAFRHIRREAAIEDSHEIVTQIIKYLRKDGLLWEYRRTIS